MRDLVAIAWAAGFIEGEGYFAAVGERKRSPSIRVSQVQREPLDRLVRTFGGQIHGPYTPKNAKATNFYRWDIGGPHAIAALFTIYAFLSPKRRAQARLVIAAWRTAPGQNARNAKKLACLRGHQFSERNTYFYAKRQSRNCRACHRERQALRRKAG